MEIKNRLIKSGFEIVEDGELFHLKSEKTGALVKIGATESELRQYVKCIDYVNKRHGHDIKKRFSYVRPVHR